MKLFHVLLLPLLCDARLASVAVEHQRALAVDCNVLSCDDGNSLTIDTCDPTLGCQQKCDDGNACTREAIVDGVCQYVDANKDPYDCSNPDGSDCIPGLIDCSDDNPFTTDVCVPSTGCRHFAYLDYVGKLGELNSILAELEAEETIFYEEQSTLSEDQKLQILDWIKLEVTQLRTPFCWRRSYGRGVGEPLNSCPAGKDRVGLLCLNKCQPGYSRQGTLDCQQNCKDGWRDDGLFCRLAEYGRGVGFPWKFGDPLNDRKMFQRCEAAHGSGNCEKHGLIVYPKCKPGYSPFGCCICRPSFESCEAEGYARFRIDLSCAVKIKPGNPTPLICKAGLEQDLLLCYEPCKDGYNGVGPVCWQECDSDQTGCVAGCARDTGDCIFALTDQLITPAITAANLATLGANAVPSAAAGTAIEIANTLYEFATVAGQVMGWLAATLEVTNPEQAPKKAKVVSISTGNIVLDGAISATLYGAEAIMNRQFAKDFVAQTSPEIAQALASNLDPRDVILIQRTWAEIQFWELASAEGWNLANLILSTFGVLDITGITNLLAAYIKPICLEIIPFPVITAAGGGSISSFAEDRDDSYEADCQDVQVYTNIDGNCQAIVDPISVDGGSLDPDHEHIFYSLSPEGPFPVSESPQRVTLTSTHEVDETSESCTASITVLDETPAIIACPIAKSQNNTPGLCGATVVYDAPQVTDNCWSSSTTIQTSGLSSASVFPVGTTTNAFEVVDSSGNVDDECQFAIGIFDNEKPQISCDGLKASIPTNPGECLATHKYTPPVGRDNCEASTVLTESPSLDPHLFPLGVSTVEYTATDLEGNSASCSFAVEVYDDEKPVASCEAQADKNFVFTIGGSDNCSEQQLKAYVVDSVSGVRFPADDHYELGTVFEYTMVAGAAPTQEQDLSGHWKLTGQGAAQVMVEDETGNQSLLAVCE